MLRECEGLERGVGGHQGSGGAGENAAEEDEEADADADMEMEGMKVNTEEMEQLQDEAKEQET
jgi:hypothetical protein